MDGFITVDEYRERLARLCARGGSHTLPRRRRDQLILLHALSRRLRGASELGERAVNERIAIWLQEAGRALDIDVASLRRALIDEGFLERTPDGARYHATGLMDDPRHFDAAIAGVDADLVIEEARAEAARRHRNHDRREQEHGD